MKIIRSELRIGVAEPFSIVHISDTHLTLTDGCDNARKAELAHRRFPLFPHAQEILASSAQIADEIGAPIIHSGDLIDFVSHGNLGCAAAFMKNHDCFFCAGNHEFSQYVGEAKEDAAYRAQSLDMVQQAFRNDIRMDSRVIGGVNFVALDDGYYLFEPEQLAFLKHQAAQGLPIVLLLHNPIYEEKLYDDLLDHREELCLSPSNSRCAYLTAVQEEKMSHYSPQRFAQQLADETTRETVSYIKREPLIKAVIAGHLHCDYDGFLTATMPQLITSHETVRIIDIV